MSEVSQGTSVGWTRDGVCPLDRDAALPAFQPPEARLFPTFHASQIPIPTRGHGRFDICLRSWPIPRCLLLQGGQEWQRVRKLDWVLVHQ